MYVLFKTNLCWLQIEHKMYFCANVTLFNWFYYGGECLLICKWKVLTLNHLLKVFIKVTFPPLSLKGVVEGDLAAVEAYKSSGGDIARQLTSDEVRLLNRPSAFDDGFTLVHLAIRFQRQDMLAVLLTEVSGDER